MRIKVIKRDGEIVDFDQKKIENAVRKAFEALGKKENYKPIAEEVAKRVKERYNLPHVEQIQDIVEETLMDLNFPDVARAYILYREKKSELRKAKQFFGVKDDLKLNLNAIQVLRKRYLLKDNKGNVIETPRQMFWRVARYIGLVEALYLPSVFDKSGKQKSHKAPKPKLDKSLAKLGINEWDVRMLSRHYSRLNSQGKMKVSWGGFIKSLEKHWKTIEDKIKRFYSLMVNLEFIPNSPTLMNAGTRLGQLSACFVLPVEDSIPGIFNAVKWMAMVQQSGGGTGFSFSRLRPKGDIVQSTKGIASGPVSFMTVFDKATDVIKQGGKRRGANMGILRVDHPDIMEFITAKNERKILQNFNISVAVTDEFMEAVEKDRYYHLVSPRTRKPVARIKARDIFELIVMNAWKNGDPGMLFLDEINRKNPTPKLGSIEATNPCGELPLLPFESCNLGSINLRKMTKKKNGKYEIDWNKLEKTVRAAVRFLDNVIDANNYSLPQIENMTMGNRKIGLGVMGWAEMLLLLGIKYDSEEALKLAEKLMRFISGKGRNESIKIAKEKGSFPNLKKSVWNKKLKELRNATITTIAPTGTISIIAGCSSSIEPLFAIAFVRRVLEGAKLLEINQEFEMTARKEGFYSKDLMYKIARTGSIQGMTDVPKEIRGIFVTALDISPEWHVKMQAAFQRYTDNAVSKTINLKYNASPSDVRNSFMLAWKLKCKGITVYRYGSKEKQVLYIGPLLKGEIEKVVSADAEFAGGCPGGEKCEF